MNVIDDHFGFMGMTILVPCFYGKEVESLLCFVCFFFLLGFQYEIWLIKRRKRISFMGNEVFKEEKKFLC